ncbi:MAG: bacterial Ig-like domain-containing protein [Prevotella sp.]|nr:bacterial Ig-like domain-containing protein [Prevotella sp.]MBR2096651.1 bacterial Ig-like domain-containing protein [Prevotella sp.]
MSEYNFHFDWNKISTLGKVRILVEQVVGSPSQAQISQAVADYIDSHPGALSPLSQATKSALLDIAEHVAYIDANGQSYYNALSAALNAKALLSITAVYTQTMTVIASDSLDILKDDLVVTGYYDDGTSAPIDDYTLSGTLTAGTSTITAEYSGMTASFDVTVSSALYKLPVVPETTVTSSGRTATVSVSADGLITYSGAIRDGIYIKPDGTVTATQPQGTTWWSATAGDNIDWNIHDITWTAGSGSSQSQDFKWANADASGNLMTISHAVASGSSGTDGEVIKNYPSYGNSRNYSALCFQWTNNPSEGGTVSFRIEVNVNGAKYF